MIWRTMRINRVTVIALKCFLFDYYCCVELLLLSERLSPSIVRPSKAKIL